MLTLAILQLVCLLASTVAFPWGAPSWVCSKMKPGHGESSADGDPNPFKITLSTYTYEAGDEIKGTLSAGNRTFKGFLIEVGTNSDPTKEEATVGEFVNLDGSLMKHVCGKGGITHTSKDEKAQINFTWKAPNSNEDLYFRATVVQLYEPLRRQSVYWMNAFSGVLKPKLIR